MTLAIIIINFRTPQYTIDCLASLVPERADIPALRVLLVENNSGDDSTLRITEAIAKKGWSDWVEFMPQEKNLGFAGGNNVAIRKILAEPNLPEFVLLLNSDIIVHRGCLKKSIERMQREPDIGNLSCMLRNRDGSVQNVCRKFARPDRETVRALGLPYLLPKLFHWADLEDFDWNRETTARDVEWIGGAFMLLRTDVLKKIGGLDETFFFYGEDTEFCHRIWQNGWRIYFDPAGEITHFGGGSSDPTRLADRRKVILTWIARFRVQEKCYGKLAAFWIRAMYTLSVSLNLFAMLVTGRRGSVSWQRTATNLSVLLHPLKI